MYCSVRNCEPFRDSLPASVIFPLKKLGKSINQSRFPSLTKKIVSETKDERRESGLPQVPIAGRPVAKVSFRSRRQDVRLQFVRVSLEVGVEQSIPVS